MRDTAEGLAPNIRLRDGHRIPQLGLGLYKTPDDAVTELVVAAAEAGCRHFDTAAMYGNEGGLGRWLRATGLPREAYFLTTRVLNADQGYASTLAACRRSLTLLGTDHVDLDVIDWPAPRQDRYRETWRGAGDPAGRRPGTLHRGQQLPPPPPRAARRGLGHGPRGQPGGAPPVAPAT